jgi:hypothetical protein
VCASHGNVIVPSLAQLRAFFGWRRAGACRAGAASTGLRADPMTGSCDLAADCGGTLHQTRGQMTTQQVANVDALKAASAEFIAMRRLAMRFRGLLRGGTPERLDAWLT